MQEADYCLSHAPEYRIEIKNDSHAICLELRVCVYIDRQPQESVPTSEDNLITSPRRMLTHPIGGIPTSGYAVVRHLLFNSSILSSFVIIRVSLPVL
jgi:hypothetical protein